MGAAHWGPLTCVYFAYGSNLCEARLRRRVPGARLVGRAELEGHSLRWHKRSTDGSGKCSIAAQDAHTVHGALYTFPLSQKARLDRIEGVGVGYEEVEITVRSPSGRTLAYTYVASPDFIEEPLKPYSWYHALVVEGASTLGLPPDYIDGIRQVEVIRDHDSARATRSRGDLPCGSR